MTISTQFVRDFQKKARHIKGRNILPIVNYLLFQWSEAGCVLKKTSIDAYLEATTDGAFTIAAECLVEESKLYEIANATSDATISISVSPAQDKQYTITLKAGSITRKHQVDHHSSFPVFIAPAGTDYVIDMGTINCIQTASTFMLKNDTDLRTWMRHVHLSEHGIHATDAHRIYECKGNHDKFSLPIDAINALSGAHHANLLQADNYLYIRMGNVTYGFQKMEFAFNGNLGQNIPKANADAFVTFDKTPLLQFLNMVPAKDSAGAPPLVSISYDVEEMNVVYADTSRNEYDNILLPTIASEDKKSNICFNAEYLSQALTAINSATIEFHPVGNFTYTLIRSSVDCVFIAGIDQTKLK